MPSGYLRRRLDSFRYAFRGFAVIASQANARLNGLAAVLACAAGFAFGLSAMEWGLVVLAIVTVGASEALNTAIELVADRASPGYDALVAKAKDVAATGVLISAVGSVVIAVLVFGPHILRLLK